MLKTLLSSMLLTAAFVGTSYAEPFPQANVNAVQSAIDADDGKALVDSLYAKRFDLTAEQNARVDGILKSYIAQISAADEVERERANVVVIAANLDRMGISDEESEKTLLTLVQSVEVKLQASASRKDGEISGASDTSQSTSSLPTALDKALQAKDASAAISYLTAKQSEGLGLGEQNKDLVNLILSYAKPLPAANAKANKEAYQALAILEPDNATYQQKAASYEQIEKESRLGAVKKLKKKVDDFNGITFYTSDAEPRYADTRSYLLPYLAVSGNAITLRVQLHYTAKSWLFVRSASLNIDGRILNFDDRGTDWKRDNDSEIWEWVDVVADSKMRKLLEDVVASNKTIIRFDGQQYYDDMTVSAKDKAAIQEVLIAEEVLRAAQ